MINCGTEIFGYPAKIFFVLFMDRVFNVYLTIILRNRAEYRLILSRRGRRPSRLKSDDIPQD